MPSDVSTILMMRIWGARLLFAASLFTSSYIVHQISYVCLFLQCHHMSGAGCTWFLKQGHLWEAYIILVMWLVMYEFAVPGRPLNLDCTKLPRLYLLWESFLQRRISIARPGNLSGTSWLVIRNLKTNYISHLYLTFINMPCLCWMWSACFALYSLMYFFPYHVLLLDFLNYLFMSLFSALYSVVQLHILWMWSLDSRERRTKKITSSRNDYLRKSARVARLQNVSNTMLGTKSKQNSQF